MPEFAPAAFTAVESFYVVEMTTGTVVYIDDGTRKQIEAWINDNRADADETLTVDDIYGAETIFVRGYIVGMWYTTPELRRKDRLQRKANKAEVPPGDDP